MNFKVGQQVRCILGSADLNLKENNIYKIEGIENDGFVLIHSEWCDKIRFQPVETSSHEKNPTTLPTDSTDRKNYPLYSGCLRYFPAALAGVAKTSKLGNDKHNPGEEMHHARGKSMDHGDCILRHLIDVEDLVAALSRGDANVTANDILLEVNQMAWRVLAFSQDLHEKFGAPLAPGAKK